MWIKIAIQEISPITLVSFRVLLGFLFGTIIIFIQRVKWPKDFKSWVPLLIIGITNLSIPFLLISWGEQSIDSAVASILDATVPLFAVVIAHFLLQDDKMTLQKVLGLLIGFAGVVILLSKDIGSSPGSIVGQFAVIIASIFYAWSAVFIRKKTVDTPGILRSTIPLMSATVVMWSLSFIFERHIAVPQLGLTWIAVSFLGIIGSGVAFFLAYYLIHEIGPSRSTMVTYIFPLGGVILGVIFLHEELTWQLIAGAVLIIFSLAVTNWRTAEKLEINKTVIETE